VSKRIAVIPGDGVGPEVVAQGLKALQAVCPDLEFETFPWGSGYYQKTGQMMPDSGLEILRGFDAIYLGAIGWPTVPDHISLWGLLLPIRKRFEQYVNLRPVRLLPGSTSPLLGRGAADIDMLFVRENTEGEYSGAGGRVHIATPNEVAVEVPVFSRMAIERVIRYAFERARERRHHLVSVTKSNASRFAYVLWDGLAASANLNPEHRYPSMFEPVHGSAPDIAGTNRANPIGAVWSGALMLQHLGFPEAAQRLEAAIARTVREGRSLTPDLGGSATTIELC